MLKFNIYLPFLKAKPKNNNATINKEYNSTEVDKESELVEILQELFYQNVFLKDYKMELWIYFMESNKTKDRQPKKFKIK